MFLTVLLLFVTSALICSAAPTLENDHCGKPGEKEGATLQGNWNAETYSPGTVAKFACVNGYIRDGPIRMACIEGSWLDISRGQCKIIGQTCGAPPVVQFGDITEIKQKTYQSGSSVIYKCANYYKLEGEQKITCRDGEWEKEPVCRVIGQTCGAPPVVQFGDITEIKQKAYQSGSSVIYKCANFYKLDGEQKITCRDGEWEKEPVCRVPCTVKETDVQQNNIQLKNKWGEEGNKKLYSEHADYMSFECRPGYQIADKNLLRIQCLDGVLKYPRCLKKVIGQTCGAPPVVQFGDITEIKQKTYQSGSSVIYKCANLYKLEGEQKITCRDGEWENEPVCRVPCTVKETDMQQNNIQFIYRRAVERIKKLYSEHGDYMTFECKSGYRISSDIFRNPMRIQCLDGVLKYPRCLKEGSCVLQQTEMAINNIHYNKSTEIENGQTIEFECEEGMVSENDLQATCKNEQIKYPKCSAGRSCPPPRISNAKLSPEKQDGYESGSSVNIKCEDTFVLRGHINLKCQNGQWDEVPQCLKPCTIIPSSLERNHIERLPRESALEILEHGTDLNLKCKANFKRQGSLMASCYDGVMKYPRCFSGGTCRIFQMLLDDNFLELDERHDNEVFYEEGQTVSFKCKTGYRNRGGLTGTCTKSQKQPAEYTLTYPTCEQESAV